MNTQLLNAIQMMFREEVRTTLRKEIRVIVREEIRAIVREELKPIIARLDAHDKRFDALETTIKLLHAEMKARLKAQDDKLDTMLEAWSIQKMHRQELDDHERRITAVEHHIPAIS